ncbi:MAG: hypothetical protein JOZ90_13515 [Alphaproteobacteria bacterium]|nr:hypothetical protein [Alphaproteobacteria bacterium]MBV9372902.1 hypothetical protein [Alphaproteobacteria bacterium]MBV9902090.1 hypothetical protein [Alphaproteobacteria bacterium]
MLGKIIGAAVGRRLAGPNNGGTGALLGYLAPAVARRGLGPLGLLLAGGYVAKKVLNRRRDRRAAA